MNKLLGNAGGWLNDAIIHALLDLHISAVHRLRDGEACVYIHSGIAAGALNGVDRFINLCLCPEKPGDAARGARVFECEHILVPHNIGNAHWILFDVRPRQLAVALVGYFLYSMRHAQRYTRGCS